MASYNIVLWDIVQSCSISGSSDSSLQNIIPNYLSTLLDSMPNFSIIVLNGAKAADIFAKYYSFSYDRTAHFLRILTCNHKLSKVKTSKSLLAKWNDRILLPSTSPANAKLNLRKLCSVWNVIKINKC